MNQNRQNKAFTILELIIVIIIVGILASLALPRFFKLIEFARSVEALNSFNAIRQAVERCYYVHNNSFLDSSNSIFLCRLDSLADINTLDLEDPGKSPNAHFSYKLQPSYIPGDTAKQYFILFANRNTRDNGNGCSFILSTYYMWSEAGEGTKVTTCATGPFKGLTNLDPAAGSCSDACP